MATPTEIAFRAALAHPRAALDFLDRILDDQIRATLSKMSDLELDYLHELIERRNAEATGGRPWSVPSANERAILADLAERREAGEIPLDRREHRKSEGWWGFLDLLRSFACNNGLPTPAIDHQLNAYSEQVVRDLFANYGLTPSASGVPLPEWSEEDHAAIMELWATIKLRQ